MRSGGCNRVRPFLDKAAAYNCNNLDCGQPAHTQSCLIAKERACGTWQSKSSRTIRNSAFFIVAFAYILRGQDLLCPGIYEQTRITCNIDGNSDACASAKSRDDYFKSSASLAVIGMLFMIVAFFCSFIGGSDAFGKAARKVIDNASSATMGSSNSNGDKVCCCCTGDMLKMSIIVCSLIASVCFLVAFSVFAGACPCAPGEECTTPRREFCLLHIGTACDVAPIFIYK